ncbi:MULTISPECIES: alpha/beta fold hydrolase [Pantoea]|uniref:Proline iminopeptidase n=1 Tax=Candidatus Pantoea floridensis TaxID=1938870 RepID=A0A286BZW3_9GAMM|nr:MULTISPECIES: alpha/beta hydrolase [Pantoea]PIF22173.1 proline iminopeptidase [Enterobacteriaceae bacterium JKS000233]PXW18543.1 proline iminopeptidase [Pantoea sp. JKS000250]SOD39680.1 proline iminopeptidase [Pantoea floridensis]
MFAELSDETLLFFDVVGTDLEGQAAPLSSKPIVIALAGGYGFDHAYLRPGLDDLSEDCQIIYVDMRGQGRSSDVKLSSIQFERMADDVYEFMKLVGIQSAFIFGHDSGSFIAQKIAMRHPETVKGLILVSSSMGMTVLPGKEEEGYPTPFLKDRTEGELLDIAHNFYYSPLPLTESQFKEYFNKVGPFFMAPQNGEMFASIFNYVTAKIDVVNHYRRLVPFFNSHGKISLVKTPSLVMSGVYDWATPSVGSFMLSKKLYDSTFVEFKESGHYLFNEEPEKFKSIVKAFIASHN